MALVKDALDHLYDYAHLGAHALAASLPADAATSRGETGRRMSERLLSAIQALKPPDDAPGASNEDRQHAVLDHHYTQAAKMQEVARTLDISERQAYRDLRRGQERIAALLLTQQTAAPAAPLATGSPLQQEIDRIKSRIAPLDLREVLTQARDAVSQLAAQRGTEIGLDLPTEPAIASLDPLLARQALTLLISRAVQQVRSGDVYVRITAETPGISVYLRVSTRVQDVDIPLADETVTQLAARLGWSINEQLTAEPGRIVRIELAMHRVRVLVIDDNEGLAYLFERYLADHACQIIAAHSGEEGMALARSTAPDMIVLDVMMPDIDGWELLQRLRAAPSTSAIPVVICSVINDPELALSLGAAAFLTKPFDRSDVLDVLRQLNIA